MECSLIYQEVKNNATEVICTSSSSTSGGLSSSFYGYEFLCTENIGTGTGTGSVMFALLHVLRNLSLVLFLCHLVSFLLLKLFGYLYIRAVFRDQKDHKTETDKPEKNKTIKKKKYVHWADENITIKSKIPADNNDVVEEQDGILFWLSEAPFSKYSLLGYEEKEEYGEIPCLEQDNSFVPESPCIFPLKNHGTESDADHLLTDQNLSLLDADQSPVVSTPENIFLSDLQTGNDSNPEYNYPQMEREKISDDQKETTLAAKIDIVEIGIMTKEKEENNFCGESTITGESTSKSSVEWRSSTVTKDSETEYPFSSSSRKSSSRWESYAFRKYDEEMLYFHRISSEKLTETESYRSLTYQPRSVSQRIYHKLTTKHIRTPDEIRNPYRELENAYVAQICLAWEALNWNYSNFFRKNPDPKEMGRLYCPARVAQEFQQFQVLLQRFIENEPYEYGRRPEVYARMKIHSPKLLLVPEFAEVDDQQEAQISAIEFLLILKDIIRTFLNFVDGDKQTRFEKFRSMIKKKSTKGDQNILNFLKKANNKKKMRVKDLIRRRKCFIQRKLIKVEDEMEIIMGLIDLKVVSRVLRMPNVTEEQLHWCEQKMLKVRVLEGRIQRDSSPLAFPLH